MTGMKYGKDEYSCHWYNLEYSSNCNEYPIIDESKIDVVSGWNLYIENIIGYHNGVKCNIFDNYLNASSFRIIKI